MSETIYWDEERAIQNPFYTISVFYKGMIGEERVKTIILELMSEQICELGEENKYFTTKHIKDLVKMLIKAPFD